MLDASMNWGKSVRVSDLNTWQVKMVKSWKRTFPSVENVLEISAEVDFVEGKDGPGLFFPRVKVILFVEFTCIEI